MNFNQFVLSRVGATLDATTAELTRALRLKAISRAWPISVALNMTVIYKSREDRYGVYYPPEYAEQIELLEYGDRSTPPSPLIRPFLSDQVGIAKLTNELMYQMEEDLINSLGFADTLEIA